ncbi:MAG: ribbon-helix-helix protein, CopG family [Chloroflexota bacterium]|nr:ribbon-helix-helix protein, CopG family [Chloroflexota bacterium]
MTDSTRVTVTLRAKDQERLDKIAEAASLSQNDAIRKALATEEFVQRTINTGGKILVRTESGEMREIEFV